MRNRNQTVAKQRERTAFFLRPQARLTPLQAASAMPTCAEATKSNNNLM